MDTKLVDEIIDCLSGERTLFRYFSDRYAVVLLQRWLGESEASIALLKQSALGKLLNRPLLRGLTSAKGDGKLTPCDLSMLWLPEYRSYVLTLGRWGSEKNSSWSQVSRPGENLVLQLNFSRQHDSDFKRYTGMNNEEFNGYGHPTSTTGRSTLAWARVDIDLENSQALIEEIQTDWLRDVNWLYRRKRLAEKRGAEEFRLWSYRLSVKNVAHYCERTLTEHKYWSETMLTATLKFLWQEIGVKEIFYHSYETGNVLKNIRYTKPPRSLYTDLPKQFCFQRVESGPACIEANRASRKRLKKVKQAQWFRLAI